MWLSKKEFIKIDSRLKRLEEKVYPSEIIINKNKHCCEHAEKAEADKKKKEEKKKQKAELKEKKCYEKLVAKEIKELAGKSCNHGDSCATCGNAVLPRAERRFIYTRGYGYRWVITDFRCRLWK